MPQISVIVPVYKVEDCLEFCVDSILNQTFTDFELILVDDGSPDNCGAICDEYAKKDSRVRVIHRENGGLSAARNSGIDVASGEYITFIDSDDAVTEDYLEALYNAIIENDADISVCRFKEFEDEDKTDCLAAEGEIKTKIFESKNACIEIYCGSMDIPINACSKLFKRAIVGETRFPEGRLHEDQAFIPPVCYKAKCIVAVNREMYLYRVRAESITRTKFSVRRYDDIWATDNCIKFFEEKDEKEIVEAAKIKRQKLICVYSIYAKRDGVEIPEEYRISTIKALRYLYGKVSDMKYEYYLAQVNPKYVRAYEYLIKVKKIINGGNQRNE